jgi:putative transposase
MKYSPEIHHRRSIRLKGYDYSQAGLYFITACTQHRQCLFGRVAKGEMVMNDAGEMVTQQWHDLRNRFNQIELHEFIVMPNHCHGIIEITVGVPLVGTLTDMTVGNIVGAFKSLTTNAYIKGVSQLNWEALNGKLWQRNYYERIIRNQEAYLRISRYIQTNPLRWQKDIYHA